MVRLTREINTAARQERFAYHLKVSRRTQIKSHIVKILVIIIFQQIKVKTPDIYVMASSKGYRVTYMFSKQIMSSSF